MAYIKSGQLSKGRKVNPYLLKRKREAEIERSTRGRSAGMGAWLWSLF